MEHLFAYGTLLCNDIMREATYVVRPQFLDHLEQSDWDLADFLRNGKARLRHVHG